MRAKKSNNAGEEQEIQEEMVGKASGRRWHLSSGFKGCEGMNHVKIWRRAFRAVGITSAKALRYEQTRCVRGPT